MEGDVGARSAGEGDGAMATVTDRPERAESVELESLRRRNRTMTTTAIVLAIALVAAVVWALASGGTSSAGTVSAPEVEAAVDAYIDAFNRYDREAAEAAITEDYMYYHPNNHPVFVTQSPAENDATAGEVLMSIGGYYEIHDYQWEKLGQRTVIGDGPWLVTQPIRVTSSLERDRLVEGISTLTVVDDDGVLRIARDVSLVFKVLDE